MTLASEFSPMKPLNPAEYVVQYTKIAASTVQDIASSTTVPFLGSMGTLTLSVLHCIEVRDHAHASVPHFF